MKIALFPQWSVSNINSKNIVSSNKKNDTSNFVVNKFDIPFENRAIFLSFGAIKKINKPENVSDTKTFSEYLENKIELSLKVKDEEDIQNIIDNVTDKTKADKELVAETLGRIVQFSSYNQMPNLSKELQDRHFVKFYKNGTFDANSLMYFVKDKYLLTLRGHKDAFIVDDYNLPWVEDLDTEHYLYFNRIEYDLERKLLEFVILDGFSTNIDGKVMSYNLFGADESLENITTAVVNEVQKSGKSLDEVLNGNKIETIKKLFGDDVPIEIVINPTLKDFSAKSIAEIMKPKYPDKKRIESLLNLANEFYSQPKTKSPEHINKLFCEYLDNLLYCYSPESLNAELKDIYTLIEKKVNELGKTMDDVLYVVPDDYKSFKMIASQFAKVNKISQDNFIINDGFSKLKKEPKDNVFVLFDDFFGSGISVLSQQFNYRSFVRKMKKDSNCNFLFVPVLCSDNAKNRIESVIKQKEREDSDFVLAKNIFSFNDDLMEDLTGEEIKKLKNAFSELGYSSTLSCVAFPYSSPDNNTDFSKVFTYFFSPKSFNGVDCYEKVQNPFSEIVSKRDVSEMFKK